MDSFDLPLMHSHTPHIITVCNAIQTPMFRYFGNTHKELKEASSAFAFRWGGVAGKGTTNL